jgi:hypothetical protein
MSCTVCIPPAPEHWQEVFPELDYRVVYPAPEISGFREQRVRGRARTLIQLPKVLHVPILAHPNLPGSAIELPPAGGVYPQDCDNSAATIALRWEQGAAAEVLYRLWEQGVDCSTVNVPRLCAEMGERSGSDPWTLDLDRICTRLAERTFRVSDIRKAPSRIVSLEPGIGRWFLESPFHTPLEADSNGSLLLESVPLGAHLLFETSSRACLFLYVREDTTLVTFR